MQNPDLSCFENNVAPDLMAYRKPADQDPLFFAVAEITTGRRQSKPLLTIDERGSKIARNSDFDCHLSQVWRRMTIERSVSNDFYLRSSIVLMFSIATYLVW